MGYPRNESLTNGLLERIRMLTDIPTMPCHPDPMGLDEHHHLRNRTGSGRISAAIFIAPRKGEQKKKRKTKLNNKPKLFTFGAPSFIPPDHLSFRLSKSMPRLESRHDNNVPALLALYFLFLRPPFYLLKVKAL
jgi:hypothetical protein